MRASLQSLLVSLLLGIFLTASAADEKPKPRKPVAGKADVMKHVRKNFATLTGVDSAAMEIRLRIEGEEKETTWPVLPDAEVKIHGWWGRLDQLRVLDRVWVWFAIDRDKKPRAILMVCDEMSEQDIHGTQLTIKAIADHRMTVHIPGEKKVPERELEIIAGYPGPRKPGAKFYAQTSAGAIRHGVSTTDFEGLRSRQRDWLRERWRKEGLPGTVSALHPLGGEMELLLDHEAIRWGRFLKNGDEVTLRTKRPIKAIVNTVRPWRERTHLRLVTNSGLDQMDLAPGQRIELLVPEPPQEIQAANLPPDIGRLEGKEDRLAWFLATIYCSCGIQGDRCTGMFYTQGSCNVNACGMPREITRIIGGLIDEGMSDREIFTKLSKQRGRDFWQPHLLR